MVEDFYAYTGKTSFSNLFQHFEAKKQKKNIKKKLS